MLIILTRIVGRNRQHQDFLGRQVTCNFKLLSLLDSGVRHIHGLQMRVHMVDIVVKAIYSNQV